MKILKRNIRDLGWGWGRTRYQIWSYLTPFLYALIAYTFIWIIGWGEFYNRDFVHQITASFGLDQLPDGIAIILYVILVGTFGTIRSAANALGEEIGWRGFLVPELYKTMGYTKTALLTGLIWSVWHSPILLFADYNSGTPVWYAMICFTVLTISVCFIYTWFRIKSNSLWTAVILHASHNLFIQRIFTPLTQNTGNTNYFIDEFGIVLPIVCVGFAFYFWKKRKELSGFTNPVDLTK
ncbi:MAG: CPBP family intramembrane metalloprotease [Bacteroidales bacterium]|nr:CPBP family intramembrane metalloprotease [Lentimicrobiaceae bacterium]MDD5694921.1 CPBP family intramembrane metalloprotease [Bacteroidales bacterium]